MFDASFEVLLIDSQVLAERLHSGVDTLNIVNFEVEQKGVIFAVKVDEKKRNENIFDF